MPRAKKQKDQGLSLGDANVEPNLDTHLQDVLVAAEQDYLFGAMAAMGEAADGTVLVDVIAKLVDPKVEVPGLTVVEAVGQIVTATVERDRIEEVRRNPNVLGLKGATAVHAELEFSLVDIEAAQDQIATASTGRPAVDGAGIIVGVVDFDCDFVHGNLRHPDGTTRLLYLWDQQSGKTSISPAPYNYGREFSAADINSALRLGDSDPMNPMRPYQQLRYTPRVQAHGTHVLDIAAGNGNATGHPGVAPAADLIFVHVAPNDVTEELSLGNSKRLLEAVAYVFRKADELGRPAVVNLSLGTHGGPHDGTTFSEQLFDGLLEKPGRAIVVSAGNSRERRSHTSGSVTTGVPRVLHWEIGQGDSTSNELEVWYPAAGSLNATLIAPDGTQLGPVSLGKSQTIKSDGAIKGRIFHRREDSQNGDNQIDILLDTQLPKGMWKVQLDNAAQEPVPYHAWIERDDKGQSRFGADDNPSCTLGSISCGKKTLVVGAYDARVPFLDLAGFSAEGPTRDGRHKPELCAPGVSVQAAKSLSQGAVRMSGTSMAAPHVAGVVALYLQLAGREATAEEIRTAVASTLRPLAAGQSGWDVRGGDGRVHCLALLKSKLEAAAAAAAAAGPAETASASAPASAIPIPTRVEAAVQGTHNGASFSPLIDSLLQVLGNQQARIRIEIELSPQPR